MSAKVGVIRVVVKATVCVIVWTYVSSRAGRQLIDPIRSDTCAVLCCPNCRCVSLRMSLTLQLPTAWRHVALCTFHGWFVSFTLARIWRPYERHDADWCDKSVTLTLVYCFCLVTWTNGCEGETQIILSYIWLINSRCQWPRGLRYGSATARLLGLRFRIPPWHGRLFLVSVVRCQEEVSATC